MKKICSRKDCNDIGEYRQSKYCFHCPEHYRFGQMRDAAKTRGKFVPTWDECKILLYIWCFNFCCPICNIKLKWRTDINGRKNIITLQHNDDDTVMFICYSCNMRHGNSKLSDDYFKIPFDQKYCCKCNRILYKNKFGKNIRKRDKLQGYCRKCNSLHYKERKIIMTKQNLAEQLFEWANRQKVMVPNEGMRKKFAQRLKIKVLKLLENDEVSEPKEPVRGGCVTVTRPKSKQKKTGTNDPTVLTEVLSQKGDKNSPFN